MSWLGVPFPLQSQDVFYHAELFLNKIPKVLIEMPEKSINLDTFLTALVAGGIPAIVAWFTLRSNKVSLKEQLLHQEHIAKLTLNAQVVTASRKDSITAIRSTTAKFLANVQSAFNVTNALNYENRKAERDEENHRTLKIRQLEYFNEMATLRWNIRLMLHPDYPEYQSIIDAMDEIRNSVNSITSFPEGIQLSEVSHLVKVIESGVRKTIEREMEKFESLN
ncbi:hypothetical protein [Enterobacter cloacae]|uniref:hypothetical protein n=1 Tax=Enterobacter cloacae TaxID=550 RepID=UPI00334E3EC0